MATSPQGPWSPLGASDTGKPSPPCDRVRLPRVPRPDPHLGSLTGTRRCRLMVQRTGVRQGLGTSPSKREPLTLPHRQRPPGALEEAHFHPTLGGLPLSPFFPLSVRPSIRPQLPQMDNPRLRLSGACPCPPARVPRIGAWHLFLAKGNPGTASGATSRSPSQLLHPTVAAPQQSRLMHKQGSFPRPNKALFTGKGRS